MAQSRFCARFKSVCNISWGRVLLRVASGSVVLGGALAGGTILTTAAYVTHAVNRTRKKEWSDEFHLNPEIFRMPYKDVEFSTADGVPLRGWWIPATVAGHDSERILIVMHPHHNHKSNLLGVASALWGRGNSIFMFDFRSFSKLKTRTSTGYFEQLDAKAAIEYVLEHYATVDDGDNGKNQKKLHSKSKSKNVSFDAAFDLDNTNLEMEESSEMPAPRKRLVLMGASMGGACVILSSANFQDKVDAIVTDCAFASLRDLVISRIDALRFFPAALITPTMAVLSVWNRFLQGYALEEVEPISVLADASFDTPTLFIHSENDSVVPWTHSQRMYEACNAQIKKLWIVSNTDHCGAYFANPKKFGNTVASWIEQVLDEDPQYGAIGGVYKTSRSGK